MVARGKFAVRGRGDRDRRQDCGTMPGRDTSDTRPRATTTRDRTTTRATRGRTTIRGQGDHERRETRPRHEARATTSDARPDRDTSDTRPDYDTRPGRPQGSPLPYTNEAWASPGLFEKTRFPRGRKLCLTSCSGCVILSESRKVNHLVYNDWVRLSVV